MQANSATTVPAASTSLRRTIRSPRKLALAASKESAMISPPSSPPSASSSHRTRAASSESARQNGIQATSSDIKASGVGSSPAPSLPPIAALDSEQPTAHASPASAKLSLSILHGLASPTPSFSSSISSRRSAVGSRASAKSAQSMSGAAKRPSEEGDSGREIKRARPDKLRPKPTISAKAAESRSISPRQGPRATTASKATSQTPLRKRKHRAKTTVNRPAEDSPSSSALSAPPASASARAGEIVESSTAATAETASVGTGTSEMGRSASPAERATSASPAPLATASTSPLTSPPDSPVPSTPASLALESAPPVQVNALSALAAEVQWSVDALGRALTGERAHREALAAALVDEEQKRAVAETELAAARADRDAFCAELLASLQSANAELALVRRQLYEKELVVAGLAARCEDVTISSGRALEAEHALRVAAEGDLATAAARADGLAAELADETRRRAEAEAEAARERSEREASQAAKALDAQLGEQTERALTERCETVEEGLAVAERSRAALKTLFEAEADRTRRARETTDGELVDERRERKAAESLAAERLAEIQAIEARLREEEESQARESSALKQELATARGTNCALELSAAEATTRACEAENRAREAEKLMKAARQEMTIFKADIEREQNAAWLLPAIVEMYKEFAKSS